LTRLHALQYLRAIAAFIVVYSHTAIQIPAWKSILPYTGTYGVDIFFVISGFIMVYISKPNDTPTKFIANRIRRVVPLYWFFTLLMASILFLLPSVFKTGEFSVAALIQSLLFIPHYSLQNPNYVWPIVAPGWSLNYEMYFYLLFAISLFFKGPLRVGFVIFSITVIWAICTGLNSNLAIPRFFSDPAVFEFIAGMLLALAWQRGLKLPPIMGWICIILGFGWAIGAPEHISHTLRISLPSLLIVLGFLYIVVPVNRIGLLLGDASYAIYLSHIFVLGALRVFVPSTVGPSPLLAWGFVLLSLIATSLVGIAVHLLIDNWLLRTERLSFIRSRQGSTGPA